MSEVQLNTVDAGTQLSASVIARFWIKVDKTDSCWLWNASLDGRGYGQFELNGKPKRAHRIAWEIANGEPPPSHLHVCHKCDVRSCVRPDHLFLGTDADNLADMDAKGRRVNSPQRGEKHGMHILTAEQVLEIRSRALNGEDQHAIGKEFGVSNVTVCAIKTRRIWKWLE